MNHKKNSYRFHGREQGVVLLTCLVFLLVLLAMLRYTITSAQVEEQKAGIDLDITSARESAESALKFAEFYIVRQGELFCVYERTKKGEPTADCPRFAEAYANLLFRKSDVELSNINLNDPQFPDLKTLIGNGIYSGETLDPVKKRPGCSPAWICVQWPTAANAIAEKAQLQRTQAGSGVKADLIPINCPVLKTNNTINACNATSQTPPSLIIERLTSEDIDPNRQGLAVEGTPSSRGIVFRVTAVGYGNGLANANNLTSVMIQGTYVIPNI